MEILCKLHIERSHLETWKLVGEQSVTYKLICSFFYGTVSGSSCMMLKVRMINIYNTLEKIC